MHLRFAGLYDEDGADRAPPDSVELVGVLCGSQSSGRFKVAQAMSPCELINIFQNCTNN